MNSRINKITHIVGARIFWTVKLLSAGAPTNLSNSVISFRGKLNDKDAYQCELSRDDNFTVRFSANDLIDELNDKKLEGRFYFAFTDGTVRTSQQILIVVKQ